MTSRRLAAVSLPTEAAADDQYGHGYDGGDHCRHRYCGYYGGDYYRHGHYGSDYGRRFYRVVTMATGVIMAATAVATAATAAASG